MIDAALLVHGEIRSAESSESTFCFIFRRGLGDEAPLWAGDLPF